MKYRIGLIIAFLSGIVSTWAFIDIKKDAPNTTSASFNNTPMNIEHSARIDELKNEVNRLKIENSLLTDKLNSITNKIDKAPAEQGINPTIPDLAEQELAAYKLKEVSTDIIEKIGDDLQNYADKIFTDFNNENKDIFWSEEQEKKLSAAITQDTELSGIAIRDIECKTSQCKIIVFSGNAEQSQEIFEKLTKSIGQLYQNPTYYTNPLESNGTKTIYFKIM